jgi:U4/U6.U5 tri-snRNP-associated protein 2
MKGTYGIPPDITSTVSPFLFLAVDLPPPPLFQDSVEKNIIPQVSIHSVLAKYDGRTTQVSPNLLPGPIHRLTPQSRNLLVN